MRWLWRSAFRQRVQLRFIYDRLFSTLCIKPVTLRPYQEQCLSACEDALEGGNSRIGVSLPTGAGKTTIFISLLARIKSSSPKSTRSIVIVNSVELARQTAEQVSRLFPSWTVEIEQGARYKASGSADVTVATYQTLLQPERIAKFDVETLKAIIVDEAHHAAAPSYRRILSHFDPEIKNPDPQFVPPRVTQKIPIVGFSATFSRHDGLALGSIFQRIVYHRDFLNMIKEQWLCDVRFTNVKANINLKEVTVNSRTGDFNPTSLAQVINTDTINHLVVQTWLDRAASERKSTLVFCVNVAHVEALTQVFRGFGIDARYIYSKTPAAERKALVSAFKNGQFPVLLNCAILTEGADIPNIDCVIVARPTRSRNVFAQMIGRGMRLSPVTGKTDCRIIDFVDSLDRVSGVVSSPTLFGLDPDEVTEDESLESMEQRATESIGPSNSDSMDDIPEPTSITYTDYDNPFSFVQDSSGTPSHVMQLSSNAWVGCGNEIYVLECLGKGFVKIEHDEGDEETEPHYRASFTPAALDKETAKGLKITPYFRSRHVLTANKLDEAIRGCDTYVKNKIVRGSLAVGLLRSARWRKTPATPQQVKFIAKRWSKRLDDSNQKLDSLTKGEAANIISRLKHGAQSRYQKKAKVASTAAKVAAKEAQRRNRETVRVGPLPQPTS